MTNELSKTLIAESQSLDKERKFWLDKLAGELLHSHLPYDFIDWECEGGLKEHTFDIPRELQQSLRRMSNKSHRNLYLLLMAGLTVLQGKYSGHQDIIIISPIYTQSTKGDFVNTILPIRNILKPGISFKQLLIKTKTGLKDANENLNYPIESLLYHLEIPTTGEGFPLSETVILLDNIHSRHYVDNIGANIIFNFSDTGDNLKGKLEYNPKLYKEKTAKRLSRYFLRLLQELVDNPAAPISHADFLAPDEKKLMLETFNQSLHDYPQDKTIHQLFEEIAEKQPNARAVVGEVDIPQEDETAAMAHRKVALSYRELNEKANQLARYLNKQGVTKETVVAVMMDPSIEMLIAIPAILKAGGAFLPLEPEYVAKRTEYMLKDCEVNILITRGKFLGRIDFRGETINIEDPSYFKGEKDNLPGLSTPDSLLYVIYTSGTSGKPKGVLLKNRNLVNYISWVSGALEITPGDKAALTSSFAFDLGYTALFSSLLNGAELHIISAGTYLYMEKLLGYIKEEGITYMKVTPSYFSLLVNSPDFSADTCGTLRVAILGGEPIITGDVARAHSLCPALRVMNHYGPTETTIGSIARFIDFDRFKEYEERPTIGKPISNTSVYILSENLELMPMGMPGELCIGGDGVGRGYLNRPGLNTNRFIPSPFKTSASHPTLYRTGDLARWMPDGDIEFLGRIDQQVKIRGFRIEPGEIENQLVQLESINEAVVVPVENDAGNKSLCAYVVTSGDIKLNEVKNNLTGDLPDYMVPTYFVQLEKIPLTPNGKVNRKALPRPETNVTVTEFLPPKDAVEKKIVEIWGDILGITPDKISTGSNLFDLGGHSLNLISLISRIHKDFDVEVAVNQMFSNPNLKEIAALVKAKKYLHEHVSLLNEETPNKVFCFPPGLAHGISYTVLASLIDGHSLYGFNYIEDEDRLEQYVEIITSIQPSGPYMLYGYSAGGVLSLQVAEALEKKGHEVSGIVLADCFWTQGQTREFNQDHIDFLEVVGHNLELFGLTFMEEKVKSRVDKYFRYVIKQAHLGTVNTDIHVIVSDEAREGKASIEWNYQDWAKITTKEFKVYNAHGTHRDMFEPGFLEKNAKVIQEVFDSIFPDSDK